MLVLSRKKGEQIVIDGHITLTVIEVRGAKVRLGINAPESVLVHRQEVWDRIHAESQPSDPSDETLREPAQAAN